MKSTVNSKDTKPVDTNASPSANGWCFQVGAGITLMLDNVKDFSSLKIEGATDDIEITLDDGKIYAQAKSVMQMGDRRNASKNLNEALHVLSNGANNGDAVRLIYITNIENPLSSKSSAFHYGQSYEFSVLPADAKKKILGKVADDFPVDKFRLQLLHFFGEGKNSFERVRERISEFLQEVIGDPSYNRQLLSSWFESFMVNASDKPKAEKSLELTKGDIIYPVIVLVIDPPISEDEFSKVCGHDNYIEICQGYRDLITGYACDYEFFAEVIGDYLSEKSLSTSAGSGKYNFVNVRWKNYEHHFSAIKNDETREAVVKLLLLTIITKRNRIEGRQLRKSEADTAKMNPPCSAEPLLSYIERGREKHQTTTAPPEE